MDEERWSADEQTLKAINKLLSQEPKKQSWIIKFKNKLISLINDKKRDN